mmetsp:Transcript_2005/g.5099  ORF Transcript_2005/g.5099 Transcript_2005/m.5099 type:complete len:272 (+) Transcript_2005:27-842(+)
MMTPTRSLAVAVALCATTVTGYSPRASAFVRPHAVAVARPPPAAFPHRARAEPLARAELPAHSPPQRARLAVTFPLRIIRRSVTRAFSSILATFLSFFFFGAPALAASSGTAVAVPPAAGMLAAGAGVSAAVYAASRLLNGRRDGAPAENEHLAPAPPADDAAPTISEDALLMASLRDRMLNLASKDDDEDDLFMDEDDMDQEMLDVRAARAEYPIGNAERGSTAVLEPPSDDDTDGEDSLLASPADEPPLARAEDVALLEKLFHSGDAAA